LATIYYDFSSPVNGAGTSTDPKNTWTTPGNGDVIRFKRGTTFVRTSQLSLSTFTSLTLEAWYNSDGTDDTTQPKPVITLNLISGTSGINVQGAGVHIFRNIVFRDFFDRNNPGTTLVNGVTLGTQGTYGVDPGVSAEFWYCEFYNITGNAANYNGNNSASTPTLAADRMRVMHCIFDNIGGDCIFGQAKDCEIAYNKMTRMSMLNETGDGVGLLFFNPTKCWIHHNYIDHRDKDFKHCIIVDGVDGSGNCLVEDNTLLGFGTVGINLAECKGTIRRNYIETSGIGIACNVDGTIIKNNFLMVNDFRPDNSATVGLLTSNSLVDGNTFLCKTKKAVVAVVETGTGRSGNTFRNNLIIGAEIGYKRGAGSSETRSNNAFVNTTSPYVDSSLAALSLATNDVIDPALTKQVFPSSTSTIKDTGLFLETTTDFLGNIRHNPPSIGAYEYVAPRADAGTRGIR